MLSPRQIFEDNIRPAELMSESIGCWSMMCRRRMVPWCRPSGLSCRLRPMGAHGDLQRNLFGAH